MKRFTWLVVVFYVISLCAPAFAGMGFTSDMTLSMLEKAYKDSDGITYTFSYDAQSDTYFIVVAMSNIGAIADACKFGKMSYDHWQSILDSMQTIASSAKDMIGVLVDSTDWDIALFVFDDRDNSSVLLYLDDTTVYVNGVEKPL